MKTLILIFTAIIATTFSFGAENPEHAHASACTDTQLETYFKAQAGLASDNLAAAQKAANSLLALAAEKGCTLDGKECCAAELEAAKTIAATSDIADARRAFKEWSDTILAKVEASGVAEGSAYKMHCPMAFNNKGGSWLQPNKDLRNPYYGSMMLHCGMTQKEYGSKSAQNGPDNPSSGDRKHHN